MKTWRRCGPAILAASIAMACSGQPARSPDRPLVALVMKSLANEFFKTMEDGAHAHQKAHPSDYDLLATGIKDEQDVAGQIKLVEQMVAQKVDALVLAPADSQALVAACKKAADAGVVVVNIDNPLDPIVLAQRRLKVPFVGPNNRDGARDVGLTLADRLKPGDKVAILEGVPGAANSYERTRGFEQAMNSRGMIIATSQPAYWETAKANQVAAAVLTEVPDLKAILCANDSMALGAVAALRAAGRERQVQVVGFDNISAVREMVKDGRVLATADQHADQLAVYGIEQALDLIKKKGMPVGRETPVDVITAESLR
jgi:ribose transport system substrate-binding protein